jgi:hypothetical protein
MAAALGEVGAGSSVGYCACLRRELSGEPDAGNLHLRFDEGRVGRAIVVALSPTLPLTLLHLGAEIRKVLPGSQPTRIPGRSRPRTITSKRTGQKRVGGG